VHAPADFRHGEGAEVAPLVVQLAVILLKPRLEFKAQQGEATSSVVASVMGPTRKTG
jgi:hypothetical protein